MKKELSIGLSEKIRRQAAVELEGLLADEFALYVQLRNFHWNIVGPGFSELHAFFEKQYEKVEGFVDEVAERIRQLGFASPGSLKSFLKKTQIEEAEDREVQATAALEKTLKNHERLIRRLREAVEKMGHLKDAGTEDFLTGLMEEHEKMAWMTRAFLA